MKKLFITLSVFLLPACATVGKLLPGGEAQAEDVGNAILANAPALAEQGGMITTMFTGNPALGGAVATLLTGAAGIFAAKKIKAKKAAGAPTA
jgi:hypothetical protein